MTHVINCLPVNVCVNDTSKYDTSINAFFKCQCLWPWSKHDKCYQMPPCKWLSLWPWLKHDKMSHDSFNSTFCSKYFSLSASSSLTKSRFTTSRHICHILRLVEAAHVPWPLGATHHSLSCSRCVLFCVLFWVLFSFL